MVSDQWREMSLDDKEKWEEKARQDKARYLKQKEEYAGPWKVPADMKKPKDPTAPKKPTPAYFSFSNARRQAVKKENPTASNGEISKILSKMWKEADVETRGMHADKEKTERELYNKAVEEWKKERKESGRENWWENADIGTTPTNDRQDDGAKRKRARLDMLAEAAPRYEVASSGIPDQRGAAAALDMYSNYADGRGGSALSNWTHQESSSFPQPSTIQELLSSARQNPVSQQEGPPQSSNPQMLDALQQLLGGSQHQQQQSSNMNTLSQSLGSTVSFGHLLGGSLSNSNHFGNQQQSLLATLLGGSGANQQAQQQQQQQQQQPMHPEPAGSQNLNDILSLLRGQSTQQQPPPPQQPQQNLQAIQASLLQHQDLLSQLQQQQQQPPPPPESYSSTMAGNSNTNSMLASLLGRQHQDQHQYHSQPPPQSSSAAGGSSDQLTQSLLQRLLQQQPQQTVPRQQQGSSSNDVSSALEEALSRLVRGGGGNQQSSFQQHPYYPRDG
jgi:hypothetical protein